MTHEKGHDAAGRRSDPERWAILDAEARAAKAKRTGTTPFSPDLDAKLKADILGTIAAAGGGSAMSSRNPFFGAEEQDYPVRVRRGKQGKGPFGFPTTIDEFGRTGKTALQSQLMRDLYRMEEDQLSELQRRLYAAGFYPGDVELADISFGDHDEDTAAAYKKALKRAAAFNEADADVTLDEVIDKAIASNAGKEKGRKREPLVIELTDPTDIRQGVEAVARKALGRKLSEEEREKFVGLYQSLQAQAQRRAYSLEESGGTVTAPPSLNAFLAEKVRKEYGVEAGAHDLADQFGAFGELLREVGG